MFYQYWIQLVSDKHVLSLVYMAVIERMVGQRHLDGRLKVFPDGIESEPLASELGRLRLVLDAMVEQIRGSEPK